MRIDTVVEAGRAGTAGALALAADRLDEDFLLVNGDSLFDFNWLALCPAPGEVSPSLVRMALAAGVAGTRYGRVVVEGGKVRTFTASGPSDRPINAGVYLMRKTILSKIGTAPCSLERDVLPGLAIEGLIDGCVVEGPFIDIGIPEDFERAQILVPSILRRPAAFLHRDGVLTQAPGYLHRSDHLPWFKRPLQTV